MTTLDAALSRLLRNMDGSISETALTLLMSAASGLHKRRAIEDPRALITILNALNEVLPSGILLNARLPAEEVNALQHQDRPEPAILWSVSPELVELIDTKVGESLPAGDGTVVGFSNALLSQPIKASEIAST